MPYIVYCLSPQQSFRQDTSVILFYNGRNEFTREALLYAWIDTRVNVSSSSDEFIIVTGQNYTEVSDSLSTSLLDYLWPVPKIWSSATSKSIGTFQESCVGVKYEGSKTVKGEVCIIEKCKLVRIEHSACMHACGWCMLIGAMCVYACVSIYACVCMCMA